jgi:hypothetical protein
MCHITVIVSPMPPEMLARVEAKQAAGAAATGRGRGRRGQESRRARVARSRGEQVAPVEEETPTEPADEVEETTDEVVEDEPTTGEPTDEMVEDAEQATQTEDSTQAETDSDAVEDDADDESETK